MSQKPAGCQLPLEFFEDHLPLKPYHTEDLALGLKIRKKAEALKSRYVQPNGPTHRYWLVFDIDRPDAGLYWDQVNAPPPNIVAINPENGHGHVFYALETPVRTAPDGSLSALKFAAAVEAGLREKLAADPGYSALIAKNPTHKHWFVCSWENHLYTLDELTSYIDLPEKPPKRENCAGLGRNCDLFDRLRKWAYRAVRQGWPDYDRWHEAVLTRAQGLNTYAEPLQHSEIKATAKSVARYTHRKFSPEGFSAWQAHQGRKGGKASKRGPEADSERTLKPWEAMGVSRRTYYRRKNGTR